MLGLRGCRLAIKYPILAEMQVRKLLLPLLLSSRRKVSIPSLKS